MSQKTRKLLFRLLGVVFTGFFIWMTYSYLRSIGQGILSLMLILAGLTLFIVGYWLVWARKAKNLNRALMPLLPIGIVGFIGSILTNYVIYDIVSGAFLTAVIIFYELKDWPTADGW